MTDVPDDVPATAAACPPPLAAGGERVAIARRMAGICGREELLKASGDVMIKG